MPQTTITVTEGSGLVVYPKNSQTSQSGSGSVRSHRSSGGSQSFDGSAGSEGSWTELEPPYEDEDGDEIEPSDSASHSRQPASRGYRAEARPAPTRRHSSRRVRRTEELIDEDEAERPRRRHSSRRHHSSRRRHHHNHDEARRVPSDESSSTVASHDDYPYGHHGGAQYPPQMPPSGYRHVRPPHHGGYPPSIITSNPPYVDPYSAQAQALVHMPQQDAFGYPPGANNPFSPQGPGSNPFSPMSTASGASYFQTDPHAPPMQHHPRPPPPGRPHSVYAPSTVYGSEMMSPYQHPMMHPGYMMGGMPGMAGYPPMPGMPGWPYPPQSTHSSPPPQDEKRDEGLADLKELIKKQEEARLAWEKEMIAKREAEAAAAAAKKAKEEEEKKKTEEIAAASKKAKEDAEKKAEEAAKKATEEHEKKLKEVEAAKEEAEKKQKELEEETKKLTPAPDMGKLPIRFKDAVGRKFSFPFHLCKTWKGMESLIKQAFLHVDVLGDHVHQGHYDLMGPDGEIILPQVWETMIQPDWEISMHMWPMPEDEPERKKKDKLAQDAAAIMDPFAAMGLGPLGDLGIVDPGKKKVKKSDSKKKKSGPSDHIIDASGIPPPPAFPPGMLSDPLGMAGMFPPGITPVEDKKDKKGASAKGKAKNGTKSSSGLAGWFAGSSGTRPAKKDDEKFGPVVVVRRRSGHSSGNGSVKSSHSSKNDRATCAVM